MRALLLLLLLAAPVEAERYLIAVGNHEGLADEEPLRYAGADARRFAEVMERLGAVRRATVLIDASPRDVEEALAALSGVSEQSTLIFYYSGHGAEAALHLAGEALPIERLDGLLTKVPARLRLTFLDACRSVGGRRSKGLVEGEPFEIDVRQSGPAGDLRVRSAALGEAAQESEQLRGAVFTHYLISGLAGAADDDGDQLITFDEAYAYAHEATLRRSAGTTAGPQRSAIEAVMEGGAPLVMTRLGATGGLLVPPESGARYLVYALPAGTPVADLPANPDAERHVAVPAGRYLVQRRAPPRFGAMEVEVEAGARRRLRPGAFRPVALTRLTEKGGGLVLHPHLLGGALGALGQGRAGFGWRGGLRYGWRPGPIGLALGVGYFSATREGPDHKIEEAGPHLDALVEWRPPIGTLWSARLGLGVSLRYVFQTLTRDDVFELFGDVDADEDFAALAAGPVLGFGLERPLIHGWRGGVEVDWSLLLLREGEALTPRTDLTLGVVFGRRF